MRVLISTRPGAGHVGPLIPFAHALLRNNDEVIVTAPAQAAPMIAEAGLDHHPIPDPPAEQRDPIFAKAKTLDPDAANALVGADLFVRIDTRAGYPHMVAAIERLQPHVMLYDISDFAAGLAAEADRPPGGERQHHPGHPHAALHRARSPRRSTRSARRSASTPTPSSSGSLRRRASA